MRQNETDSKSAHFTCSPGRGGRVITSRIQRVELTGKDGAPVAYSDAKQELLQRVQAVLARGAQDVQVVSGGKGPALVETPGERVAKSITRADAGSTSLRGLRK